MRDRIHKKTNPAMVMKKIICLLMITIFIVSLSGAAFMTAYEDTPASDSDSADDGGFTWLGDDTGWTHINEEDLGAFLNLDFGYADYEGDYINFYDLPIIDESLWHYFDVVNDLFVPLSAPTVHGTGSATGPTTASVNGVITFLGTDPIIFRGFWIRRSDQSEVREYIATSSSGNAFSRNLSGLTTGQVYLGRAVLKTPGMVTSGILSDPAFELRPTAPPGGGTPTTPPGSTPTPPPGNPPTPPPGNPPTPPPSGPTPTPAPPTLTFEPGGSPWNSAGPAWTVGGALQTNRTYIITGLGSWSYTQSSGSSGWLSVSGGSGLSGEALVITTQANSSGESRTASVTVSSGNMQRTLTITQNPLMATPRRTRVIECFDRRGYIDVNAASETSTIVECVWDVGVRRPVWYFEHVSGNVFAIRNDTTRRYLTETGGNLRHEARISGSGLNYDNRQLWLLMPHGNGIYRIRSVSAPTLYIEEAAHFTAHIPTSISLSSRNTSHNRQLWHIGYIWFSDGATATNDAHQNWFGFWEGPVYIRTEAIPPEQVADFNFEQRMTYARNTWVRALDLNITMRNTDDVSAAGIRAYGGCRVLLASLINGGVAFSPTHQRYGHIDGRFNLGFGAHMATIQVGGVSRSVNRLRNSNGDQAIMAVFSNSGSRLTRDARNVDFATMVAIHELGHALGYFVHAPNRGGVMAGVIPDTMMTPNITLSPAEIEHLRQIYTRHRTIVGLAY